MAVPQSAIDTWIVEYIERREGGEPLTAESFLREHAEGGEALLSALRRVEATEAAFPQPGSAAPSRVAGYRLFEEIGRGGMGRVFHARHDERPDEPLALKLLHATFAFDPRAFERFRREGQALERLRHPGLVRVLETGVASGTPFLVMERIDGVSPVSYTHLTLPTIYSV